MATAWSMAGHWALKIPTCRPPSVPPDPAAEAPIPAALESRLDTRPFVSGTPAAEFSIPQVEAPDERQSSPANTYESCAPFGDSVNRDLSATLESARSKVQDKSSLLAKKIIDLADIEVVKLLGDEACSQLFELSNQAQSPRIDHDNEGHANLQAYCQVELADLAACHKKYFRKFAKRKDKDTDENEEDDTDEESESDNDLPLDRTNEFEGAAVVVGLGPS
ncbi:hypothetical protein BDZ88DRAFT_442084 [Geranomyces variabilis]|nr:hypothetical protein BDZ88DRAFT_442084 [Geranomyces variabilis]